MFTIISFTLSKGAAFLTQDLTILINAHQQHVQISHIEFCQNLKISFEIKD